MLKSGQSQGDGHPVVTLLEMEMGVGLGWVSLLRNMAILELKHYTKQQVIGAGQKYQGVYRITKYEEQKGRIWGSRWRALGVQARYSKHCETLKLHPSWYFFHFCSYCQVAGFSQKTTGNEVFFLKIYNIKNMSLFFHSLTLMS